MAAKNITGDVIDRFRKSFDGHGYVAVLDRTSARLKKYKYVLVRVIHFTPDGEALTRQLDDDSGGGFTIVTDKFLTPIHEIPLSEMRKRNIYGWPNRKSGGMRFVMSQIKKHRDLAN